MIGDSLERFIKAACAPMDGSWHSSGDLTRAEAMLAAQPDLATRDIHAAAILGDDETVRRFIADDPASATAKRGPYDWDALTCLCFSKYLRLDRSRSSGFARAAEALLDAGASPNTGFHSQEHEPNPVFESVLYGAAGVAHHPELTRLLLERGADPNDDEVPYHAPETFGESDAMKIIAESGKLTPMNLTMMLQRKLDWTDYDAVQWLLEHGADPNEVSHWGNRALHHSLGRDNALEFFELLLDDGADPTLPRKDGMSTFEIAANMGRSDVLDLFERRGFAVRLEGDAAFVEACARADEERARTMAANDPDLVSRVRSSRGFILANFAGAGNTAGARLLLDLGFDISSSAEAHWLRGVTALHLATWRRRLATVKLLIERGAPLEATGPSGDTPLSLAVRALTEVSEWTPHDSTDIVAALLQAGARPESVRRFPSGSAEADEMLERYRRH
ncbi:MAG: ankyrin repeat domain-containing protein [Gemmatimonadales bacterium]